MFLLISFVAALISLYYLGVMADTYNADTTYLTPLMVLLIYSVLSIFRQLKNGVLSFLADDYNYNDSTYYRSYPTNNSYNNSYNNAYRQREEVEYFTVDDKKEKNNVQELIHYPSNKEIREKIKELEDSRWFRFKRGFAAIFGIDITTKYYEKFKKPYKVTTKCTSSNVNKEDNNRFKPNNNFWAAKEITEYNSVTKLMSGRSCEIAIANDNEDTNNNSNDE